MSIFRRTTFAIINYVTPPKITNAVWCDSLSLQCIDRVRVCGFSFISNGGTFRSILFYFFPFYLCSAQCTSRLFAISICQPRSCRSHWTRVRHTATHTHSHDTHSFIYTTRIGIIIIKKRVVASRTSFTTNDVAAAAADPARGSNCK